MNEYQQMLYCEMAHNNCGMPLDKMLSWLDLFSNHLINTKNGIDLINAMERDGNIFSKFNEKYNRTEWFIYE